MVLFMDHTIAIVLECGGPVKAAQNCLQLELIMQQSNSLPDVPLNGLAGSFAASQTRLAVEGDRKGSVIEMEIGGGRQQ